MAAVVHGVAIRPRVSRNGRRYTAEALRRAYDRLNARLAAGESRPVTMRTFHPTPEGNGRSVVSIVGRVRKVGMTSDGAITYEAVLVDTPEGKTVQQLVKPDADGRQTLGNVSIRGWWVGETRTDPQGFEVGDDLEIDGLDFTDSPGIPEASVAPGAATEAAPGGPLIFESVEEAFMDTTTTNTATETDDRPCILEDGCCTVHLPTNETTASKAPYGNVTYADPGYQKDGKKRYPLDTEKHVRAAWGYINQADNAKLYTAAQLKRVKGKIKSAAKKLGINIASETTNASVKQIIEGYAAFLPEAARPRFLEEAYACVSVGNGPADISVSAYGNDPAQLQAVIGRLADAVVAALDKVDPDGDGDIDLPNETAPNAGVGESATPAANGKEPTVATETTQTTEGTKAEETAAPITKADLTEALTAAFAPLADALKGLVPAAPAAAAAGATETAAAGTEPAGAEATTTTAAETAAGGTVTLEQAQAMAAKAAEEAVAKARNDLLNESRRNTTSGDRKGLARSVGEDGFDFSKLSEAERSELAGEALLLKLFPQQAAGLAS